MSPTIIAVGLNLKISQEILTLLRKKLGEALEKYEIDEEKQYGILFSKECPIGSKYRTADVHSTQTDMNSWFRKMSKRDSLEMIVKKIYAPYEDPTVTKNRQKVIMCEATFLADKYYVILSNMTSSNRTMYHKTNCNNGFYGSGIVLEPEEYVRIPCIPYKWEN